MQSTAMRPIPTTGVAVADPEPIAASVPAAACFDWLHRCCVWMAHYWPMGKLRQAGTMRAGPVGWWQGEGNSGDSIGGNAGFLSNRVSFAQGSIGQAFVFDGVDGFINVPHSSSLSFDLGTPFSVEAWIKTSSQTNGFIAIKM